MEKEQKTGLFRRLFGMGSDETSSDKPRISDKEETVQPKLTSIHQQAEVVFGKGQLKEELLPWESSATDTTATDTTGEILQDAVGIASKAELQEEKSLTQAGERTPTWEELLNKIAPQPQEPVATKGENSLVKDNDKSNEIYFAEVQPVEANASDGTCNTDTGVDQDSVENSVQEPVNESTQEPVYDSAQEPVKELLEESIKQEELASPDSTNTETFSNVKAVKLVPTQKAPIQSEQVSWLLEQTISCTKLGEIIKAEKFLEIAISLERHPDVILALAKHELLMGNLEKATNNCLDSLSSYPDSMEAVDFLVELVEQGAKPEYQRVAELDSGDFLITTKLAKLLLAQGHLAPALNFLAKAQLQGLDVNSIQYELGLLYENMGNPTQAKEHYHQALQMNGTQESIDTACRLFDLDMKLGLVAEAKSVAKKYLHGSNNFEVKRRLAELYLNEGHKALETRNLDEALNNYYLSLEQENEVARAWVVSTLCLIGDSSSGLEVAMEHYEAALEIGGYNREIAKKIAQNYYEQKNYSKALSYLSQLHEHFPEDTQITSSYATCLQKNGDFETASELLETLAKAGHLDNSTREQLFNYYRAQGRYEDAKRHFELLYSPGTAEYDNGLQALAWDQIRLMLDQGETANAWRVCCQELRNKPSTDMLGLAMKILSEHLDCLVAENKVSEALHELELGRALGLNVHDLCLREASLYESIGNDQAALKIYETIAKKAPEVWGKIKELYLKAATREYLAGNLAEARRLLEDAHAKVPQNEEIRRALGVLYQETGQYALAAALAQDTMQETEIQISTDHLNVLRPHGYRRIRLG